MPVIFIGRNKKATIVEELCTGCGRCVKICPEKAIEMRFRADPEPAATVATSSEKPTAEKVTPPPGEPAPADSKSKQTAPSASEDHAPDAVPAKTEEKHHKETPEEKTARRKREHVDRVIRTAIALVLGIIAGIVSFYLAGIPGSYLTYDPSFNPNWILGLLVWLVAVVIQKSLFMLLKFDVSKYGKKDWFYQGFMTFCAWALTWTMLLSTYLLPISA
ncbi:MAG TPA: 4Fe-4S binding protein [Methanocorpusculum sp.]|nr:4Fe-4S binding protein [Methanocorpusculum sp.]